MNFLHLVTGEMGVNSYLLVNDENNAVLIDAGEDYNALKNAEKTHGFKITACILTHGHFDHAGACAALKKGGVKIYVSKEDADKLTGGGNLAQVFGHTFENFSADYTFSDGDILSLEGFDFKALSTPGHTKGSVSLIFGDKLFSGDTLFYESIGRTDLGDGSFEEISASLKKLVSLGDYVVYPGHGRATTLAHERAFNPYL